VGELTGLALINGKASLEGTFLGPCILTGRVAARSILARAELTQQVENVAAPQCTDCHNIDSETIKQRPGYWHFENVHTKIMNNEIDCRECHGELSPYDEENHQINPQVLTASCIRCHLGRE
jgi:nitrate/TMAO reductase-like tetraheme cytochrome c subunit